MESILYAEVYAVCILIVGLLFSWSCRINETSAADRWFRIVLASFLLNFISNFLFKLQDGGYILPHELSWSYALKTCYYLTLAIGVYTWTGFADAYLGQGFLQKKKSLHVSLLLLAVPFAIALSNLYHHKLFTISEQGVYTRHEMYHFFMLYLLVEAGIWTFALLRRAQSEADPVKRHHMRISAAFPLCIMAAWALSFIGEAFPVNCVCFMLALLCIYFGTIQSQVSKDMLTQVNNRQNLLFYLEHRFRGDCEGLRMLMIDMDGFKQINDNYGHLEGDTALILAAGAIKRACSGFHNRPYIARYGGDEFIVVAELDDADLERIINRLLREMDLLNRQGGRPYRIECSIGATSWEPGMTYRDMMARADKELYRSKADRHADPGTESNR